MTFCNSPLTIPDRYYYAIATFDSPFAAQHVYTELDGTELERSANVIDLSYVPDDMIFNDEYRDEATVDNVAVGGYQPIDFATDVRTLIPLPCNLSGSTDLTREEYRLFDIRKSNLPGTMMTPSGSALHDEYSRGKKSMSSIFKRTSLPRAPNPSPIRHTLRDLLWETTGNRANKTASVRSS
jgi:hypothetical protein